MHDFKLDSTVTTRIYLDVRVQKKDGTYAVKLRVTYNRVQKYYPLGIHLTKEEFEKTRAKIPRGIAKERSLLFNGVESKAYEVIKSIKPFSFVEFESKFLHQREVINDVFAVFDNLISQIESEGRIGTATAYKTSKNSLKDYATNGRKKSLRFEEITVDWLINYEQDLRQRGRSATTVGIYLRALRTVFNKAIKDSVVQSKLYPFGAGKYVIPSGRNVKKALSLNQIRAVFEFNSEDLSCEKAKDFWCLSYLCNGINIKDLAHLRWSNINDDTLIFIREKTKRSNRRQVTPIIVPLLPEATEIINRHSASAKNRYQNELIFQVISESDSLVEKRNKVQNFTKFLNKNLAKIGAELDFPFKLTTYFARHSYATTLKRSGASIEMISEALGHQDANTTKAYLDSFEIDSKRHLQMALLKFNG